MRRTGEGALFPFDSEIERTLRRRRRQAQEISEPTLEQAFEPSAFVTYDNPMVDEEAPAQRVQEERTLCQYVLPTVNGVQSAIRKPAIAV